LGRFTFLNDGVNNYKKTKSAKILSVSRKNENFLNTTGESCS